MPRKKHPTRKRLDALTLQDECVLKHGQAFLGDSQLDPGDLATITEAWEQAGDRLLSKWLTHPVYAGRRPWAWWVIERGVERPATFAEEAELLREWGELTPAESYTLARRNGHHE